jgi:hypothetical protein
VTFLSDPALGSLHLLPGHVLTPKMQNENFFGSRVPFLTLFLFELLNRCVNFVLLWTNTPYSCVLERAFDHLEHGSVLTEHQHLIIRGGFLDDSNELLQLRTMLRYGFFVVIVFAEVLLSKLVG